MCASWSVMPWRGVQQQQHDVGLVDRLQGLDDRELLDRLEHLALAPQARGIDQLEASGRRARTSTSIASRVVPGGSNATSGSSPSQALISVDLPTLGRPTIATRLRGRAAVGSNRRGGRGRRRMRGHVRRQRLVDQGADALAVRRRHRMRFAQAQFVELGQLPAVGMPSALLTTARMRRPLTAQALGDVVVVRRQSGAGVERRRAPRRLSATACSACWLTTCCMPLPSLGSKPPVSMTSGIGADAAVAVVAVARQAGRSRRRSRRASASGG